jgi:hypothetical protein
MELLHRADVDASFEKDIWNVSARVGDVALSLSRDLKAKTILKREAPGFPAVFGPLAVDGKPPVAGPSSE